MSDYVLGPKSRYTNYLQAKSFEDSVNGQIARSSREIVATQEQLHAEHIEVTQALTHSIEEGLETISYQLSDVRKDIQKLDATCEWGFKGIIASLGLISNQLYDLQWMAKHPSLTWANEQFHEATRSFERGWHEESLSFIQRAINGHGSNIGCAVDFRYHYLLGAIRLGDSDNFDENIVDLNAAEKSFLDSAKFSRRDEPGEAANALVCASRAAYCQNSMENAERHAREAVSLNPNSGPAYFQVAKVVMHEGRSGDALPFLEKAIRIDRDYSWRVSMDADFTKHRTIVDRLLEKLRLEAREAAERIFKIRYKETESAERLEVDGLRLLHFAEAKWKEAKNDLILAEREMSTKTYFGYLNAVPWCDTCDQSLREARILFVQRAVETVEGWICNARGQGAPSGNSEPNKWLFGGLFYLAIALFFVTFGGIAHDGWIKVTSFEGLLGCLLFSVLVALGIPALIFIGVEKYNENKAAHRASGTNAKIATLMGVQARIRETLVPSLPVKALERV